MRIWRLIRCFWTTSVQGEMAYRANFWISLLNATLNLATGVMGLVVLFGQVPVLQGWTLDSTLALLGVYLTTGALLYVGPGRALSAGPLPPAHLPPLDATAVELGCTGGSDYYNPDRSTRRDTLAGTAGWSRGAGGPTLPRRFRSVPQWIASLCQRVELRIRAHARNPCLAWQGISLPERHTPSTAVQSASPGAEFHPIR